MIYLTLWPHCVWSTGWGIWSCSGTPPIWYQRPVQRKRINSNEALVSNWTGCYWWTDVSTYIRTDSINTIRCFGEGIIQCWDVCDDWFFIRRLNVYVWWGKWKPKGSQKRNTRDHKLYSQELFLKPKSKSFTPHDYSTKVLKVFFSESNQNVCTELTLWVQESGHPQLLSHTKRLLQIRTVGLCWHTGHVNHVWPAMERESERPVRL